MTDSNRTPEPAALIPVSLASVAEEEHVTSSTVVRWVTRGLRLPTGERVRLRAQRYYGRWVTSKAWLAEFRTAIKAAFEPAGSAV